MEKKLIGWTVIFVFPNGSESRTYYKISQSTWMEDEVLMRTRNGHTFKVEPEYGTCERRVLY